MPRMLTLHLQSNFPSLTFCAFHKALCLTKADATSLPTGPHSEKIRKQKNSVHAYHALTCFPQLTLAFLGQILLYFQGKDQGLWWGRFTSNSRVYCPWPWRLAPFATEDIAFSNAVDNIVSLLPCFVVHSVLESLPQTFLRNQLIPMPSPIL